MKGTPKAKPTQDSPTKITVQRRYLNRIIEPTIPENNMTAPSFIFEEKVRFAIFFVMIFMFESQLFVSVARPTIWKIIFKTNRKNKNFHATPEEPDQLKGSSEESILVKPATTEASPVPDGQYSHI
jgi:hypothetical protein